MPSSRRPLRIAWLIYRGNPHCGGQGVYTRYLAREVTELGHHIEVLSGQPWPELDDPAQLVKIPSLDLYRPGNPFRVPWPWEFRDRIDLQEFAIMCAAGFPEPYTFSIRARNLLAQRRHDFDLIHDNQCLGTGLLGMMDDGFPVVATLHHPITVDRDLDMEHATSPWKRLTLRRWYAFLEMQMNVAKRIPRLVTVSENSRTRHRGADGGRAEDRLHIVPVGVDQQTFRPLPDVARVPGRVMTTASADVPMKGLVPLLEAIAKLRVEREDVHLVVIGKQKEKSKIPAVLERLGLERRGGVRLRRRAGAHHRALRRGPGRGRPVALRGLLVACHRGHGLWCPARGDDRWRAARGGRPGRRGRALGADQRPVGARDRHRPPARRRRAARPHRRGRSEPRPGPLHLAASAEGMVENWYAQLDGPGTGRMLTVDFDRLGLRSGDRLLDMGCGGGRHAFAALRRGATVVAFDYSEGELKDVRGVIGAMGVADEIPAGDRSGARSTATRCTCRSPTTRSTSSSPRRCSSTCGRPSGR